MKNPLVSVVIPTYNREKTIVRAINSVLNQTYTNLELIVVDDNSKDNTESVIQEYITDKRLKYIKLTKNVGGGGARNKGITEAKGEFVAFQDSDDEWMLDKLEKQMAVFQNRPDVDVIFCQMKRILGDSTIIYPKKNPTNNTNLYTSFLKENYIGTPTAIIKKEKLVANKGFDENLPRLQDWDLFIRLAKNGKFHMLNEVLCDVYLQENSISNNSDALYIALNQFDKKYHNEIILLSKYDRSSIYEKYGSLLINDGRIKQGKLFFKKGLKHYIFNTKLIAKYITLLLGGIKGYKLLKNNLQQ